jgi:hypothetical protein
MATNKQRREWYAELKALGVTDSKLLRSATGKTVERVKENIDRFTPSRAGATKQANAVKIAETMEKARKNGASELNKLSKQEATQYVKTLIKERASSEKKGGMGKIAGKLTDKEKKVIEKMASRGKIEQATKLVTSKKSVGYNARQEVWKSWSRGGFPPSMQQAIESANKTLLGKAGTYSNGYMVVWNMYVKGMSKKDALALIKSQQMASNPTRVYRSK